MQELLEFYNRYTHNKFIGLPPRPQEGGTSSHEYLVISLDPRHLHVHVKFG
jgi:hypothetical protein